MTLTYGVNSELAPVVPLRLKIEINTREHLTVLGQTEQTLAVESGWFNRRAAMPTFTADELLGTKLRA